VGGDLANGGVFRKIIDGNDKIPYSFPLYRYTALRRNQMVTLSAGSTYLRFTVYMYIIIYQWLVFAVPY
jgi:hypothetical protein